jgi:hypothetical protein
MGAYVFFVVCLALWAAFAWAAAARPAVLDQAWGRVRELPLIAQPVVWIALLPWLTGLAVWESHRGTAEGRRMLVVAIAAAFIVFWTAVTF